MRKNNGKNQKIQLRQILSTLNSVFQNDKKMTERETKRKKKREKQKQRGRYKKIQKKFLAKITIVVLLN